LITKIIQQLFMILSMQLQEP